MDKSYNQQLVFERENRGLSIKEAAKEIGISTISLFFYERGYFRPKKKALEKIQNFYKNIDFSGEKEYPQESLFVINKKSKSKKVKLIVSGAIAAVSLGLVITGASIFTKSATNTSSYYGKIYNQTRQASIDSGQTGRDILTDLEYTYIFNKDYNGRADILFYKTNSILYFNNSTYSMTSKVDEYLELGNGRFRYQFGGSLGTSSYICTFSYKSNDAGMFFSSDILYENKPITRIDHLNVMLETSVPVTNELAISLFNARIDQATTALSTLLTNTLEKNVDFYEDFLRDREAGRTVNFRLQISGLVLLITFLASFFISLAILSSLSIGLIKQRKDEKAASEEINERPLPKDFGFQFGIPDYLLGWILKVISFVSMVLLLLSSFGGLFLKLPPLFTNETFLTLCRVGFAGGIFVRLIITLTANKKKHTLFKETVKYLLLYLTLASFETAIMGIAETWGYDVSNLIYKFVPRSVLLAAFLSCLLFYFLCFTPSYIKNKKKVFIVLWRCLAIIPLGMIIVITLVGNSYELFYGATKNIYYIFWLSNVNFSLSITSILFIFALFFIRMFFNKRYGKEKASLYFNGNRFNVIINCCYALIILIMGLVDLAFKGNTVAYYLNLGTNIWMLLFIPFVLLTKYGPNESELPVQINEKISRKTSVIE